MKGHGAGIEWWRAVLKLESSPEYWQLGVIVVPEDAMRTKSLIKKL
jgi:hypothetical protein